jgi:hypothetical protein
LVSADRRRLLAAPRVGAVALRLFDLGLVSELTGQKKNRSFSYRAYVELLAR